MRQPWSAVPAPGLGCRRSGVVMGRTPVKAQTYLPHPRTGLHRLGTTGPDSRETAEVISAPRSRGIPGLQSPSTPWPIRLLCTHAVRSSSSSRHGGDFVGFLLRPPVPGSGCWPRPSADQGSHVAWPLGSCLPGCRGSGAPFCRLWERRSPGSRSATAWLHSMRSHSWNRSMTGPQAGEHIAVRCRETGFRWANPRSVRNHSSLLLQHLHVNPRVRATDDGAEAGAKSPATGAACTGRSSGFQRPEILHDGRALRFLPITPHHHFVVILV